MVSLGLRMMGNPESPFYIRPRLSWDLLRWCYRFWRASTKEHVARSAPLLRDLHMTSRELHRQLAAELPANFDLVCDGLLVLCKTQHALDEEAHSVELAHQQGLPAEVVDPARIAQLDPQVRYDVLGGVYFPNDCHMSPDRLMTALQSQLESMPQVKFAWRTNVTGLRTAGRAISAVVTDRGEIPGDQFVLCGGVWSTELARTLDLNLPLQAGKGYSLTMNEPRKLPRLCAICAEARLAVTPMGGRLRVGGTMEIAGLSRSITASRVRGITRAFPTYYPDFSADDFAGIEPWSGLRPCSPDGLPYLGRTAQYDNLIIAAGHAMLGLSLGPITGQLVTQLLCAEPPQIDLTLLAPDRYSR
jgi:D-amino-acid dehydrogenase